MAGALEIIGQRSSVPVANSVQVFLVLISYQLDLAINLSGKDFGDWLTSSFFQNSASLY